MYETITAAGKRWASVPVAALLYVKGRSIPRLVGQLAGHLRLPEGVPHVRVGDRGLISRPLLRAIGGLGQFVLGRVRCSQVVYFAPLRQSARRRRPKLFGQKCRVDKLLKRFPQRLRPQKMRLQVRGKERTVNVFDSQELWRGAWSDRACPARVIVVVIPVLQFMPG